jgi:tetratricopeptide (TPR) repeat protein
MRDPGEIGRELFYQRRYADALPFLERALRANPRDGHLHLCLAIALASQGDTARAEQHFQNALQYNPTDAYAFYNWGAFLHQQGRYAEAIRAYERAAQLDPTLVAANTAADGLRRALGQPMQPPVGVPAAPTPARVASPPPATRDGTGWVVSGLLLALLGGLCPPCAAPLAFLCGVAAIVRGSVVGGIVVIALALLFGIGGMALLRQLGQPR